MANEYYAEVNVDEEIYCNSVTNINDFEIFTENINGRKKIIGFKFKFKFDQEIGINKNFDYTLLSKLILHYLDFLSSLTSYPLNKTYYETKIFDLNGERVVTLRVQIPLSVKTDRDIDLSKYQNTLFDLSAKKIENLRYYYAGVIFYINRLYEFSIREFFKIIEMDNSIPRYKNYRTMRHLFSHNYDRLEDASDYFRKSNLKNEFRNFHDDGRIIIIDRYDPSNVHSLLSMAKELREIVEPKVLN
jgi:hypothetical protein